jgi:hypothetical protein
VAMIVVFDDPDLLTAYHTYLSSGLVPDEQIKAAAVQVARQAYTEDSRSPYRVVDGRLVARDDESVEVTEAQLREAAYTYGSVNGKPVATAGEIEAAHNTARGLTAEANPGVSIEEV